VITAVLVDSWIWPQSPNQLPNEKLPTLKAHVSTRVKFVPAEWLLEFLLQGIQSVLSILLFVIFRPGHLRDENIEFHEDCHNGNCILSVSDNQLNILDALTVP